MKKEYCKGCYYLLDFNGRCLKNECAAVDVQLCDDRQIIETSSSGCGGCSNRDPYECLDCDIYQSLPYVQ